MTQATTPSQDRRLVPTTGMGQQHAACCRLAMHFPGISFLRQKTSKACMPFCLSWCAFFLCLPLKPAACLMPWAGRHGQAPGHAPSTYLPIVLGQHSRWWQWAHACIYNMLRQTAEQTVVSHAHPSATTTPPSAFPHPICPP